MGMMFRLVKINIIQLMKPQKGTKQKRQLSQGLPAIENNGFNQTIIINNPNFNINYIDHTAYNPKPISRQNNSKTIHQLSNYQIKNSSKGIDSWNLNKNLKEFSQTRQLGFFKANSSKSKSNAELQHSPYLSHKTKTQDIRPFTKIKPSAPVHPTTFRQNRTISTIKQQTISITPRDHSSLSHNQQFSTLDNDQSKPAFRKRKFESKTKHPKNNIQDLSDATLQPYLKQGLQLNETVPNNVFKTQRKITPLNLKTRRNRFIELQVDMAKFSTGKRISDHEQQGDMEDIENSLIIQSPKKTKNSVETPVMPARKRVYQKSIQKISKCFLSKLDNYFEENRNTQLPSSKIQLYATTVNQPSSYSYNIDYKSSPLDISPIQYDFEFEEEKPKYRPKTPYKRKKMYEQII